MIQDDDFEDRLSRLAEVGSLRESFAKVIGERYAQRIVEGESTPDEIRSELEMLYGVASRAIREKHQKEGRDDDVTMNFDSWIEAIMGEAAKAVGEMGGGQG